MAEWLTLRTPDLEVPGSSLARCIVSLKQGTLLHFVSLHPEVYKWVPATYCWGLACNGLTFRPGGTSNTPGLASCYGNRYKLWPCGPLACVRLCLYMGGHLQETEETNMSNYKVVVVV